MLFKMSAMASAILLSLALAVPAGATIITIDDFTADTPNAAWVQSTLLNTAPSTAGSYSFSTSGTVFDKLLVKHNSWVSGHRQEAYLRSDYSLGIGETLITDIYDPSSKQNSGLLIATETGIAARKNILYVTWNKNGGKAEAWYFKGDGSYTSATSATALTDVWGLYIARTGQSDYALGYYLLSAPSTKVELKTFSTAGDGNLNPGAAVGYYIYSQDNGAVTFDNLRKEVVPEPSTLALLAGGLLGLLAYAWRKRK
jgi:hypothetical protein